MPEKMGDNPTRIIKNNIPAITGILCDNKQLRAPFTIINTYENVS